MKMNYASGYRGWGPLIFALIICAQAGASVLLLPVVCCVQAIKSAVARVELHNEEQLYIASATATYMVG